MFALGGLPPAALELHGRRYRLARVFKHDFFAATCLYEAGGPPCPQGAAPAKIVVKFARTRRFCGLPMAWLGAMLSRHERVIYTALEGIEGVPRWLGPVGPSRRGEAGFAIEYIDAEPLDHVGSPPEGFFDRLRELFDRIHARGVAYCDANKRSNILVGPQGRPFLIDFQISLRRRDDWPAPLRAIARAAVNYVAAKDLYHLYKHKRRAGLEELTPEQQALSRRRGGLHWLHRKLTKPYRTLRRRLLSRQYEAGRLISPTAQIEDHRQPEKATWRKTGGAANEGHGP